MEPHFASSNEHLKIGAKREKNGYCVTSNGHHRQRRGRETEVILGTQLFMLYNIPKFRAILRGRPTKVTGK